MDKMIINFTPIGMIPTNDQTPYVPILPQEIIERGYGEYGIAG
jgi:uncharacterized protein (DUF849 family)